MEEINLENKSTEDLLYIAKVWESEIQRNT
jgi:hypothetical protein